MNTEEETESRTLRNYSDRLVSGGCVIQKMIGGKWGPYLYHVKRVGKRQIWTYLGKASELVREKTIDDSAEVVEE